VRLASKSRPLAITPRTMALATVAVAIPLWAGCSSSGGGAAKAAAAPTAVCQKILAVFSDGPDPDADPVGYALSQVLPLGQIHTSDKAVSRDLHDLIASDRSLVSSNGSSHAAKTGIKKADAALNRACPGVAS
jgi:hypothetical protein